MLIVEWSSSKVVYIGKVNNSRMSKIQCSDILANMTIYRNIESELIKTLKNDATSRLIAKWSGSKPVH